MIVFDLCGSQDQRWTDGGRIQRVNRVGTREMTEQVGLETRARDSFDGTFDLDNITAVEGTVDLDVKLRRYN